MKHDLGTLADARLEPTGEHWTLIFVRETHHKPAEVWAALTDPEQIKEWAPFDASRDLGTTGPATLTMVDQDLRESAEVEVRIAEPERVLEYTWGADVLRWELEPVRGGNVRLTLRHYLTHPDMEPMVAAGWHLCYFVLERLLEGNPVGPIRGRDALDHDFEELVDAYAVRFKESR